MINPLVESFANINRKFPPKAGPTPELNVLRPKILSLKNGLTILCVENHKLPIVRVSLIFDHGPVLQGDKIGLKDIFGQMLAAGTKKHTKEEFNQQIDQMGTTLHYSFSSIYLSSLKRYFEPSIALMSEMLLEPSFNNTQELEKLVKQSITQLQIEEREPQAVSERIQKKIFYGNTHPYAEYPTYESLRKIKLEDFRIFYKKYFGPEKAYLSFVGDISEQEAYRLAEKYFSNWGKQKGYSKKYKIKSCLPEIQINLVDVPSSTQAVISIGNAINFKKSASDYFSAIIANKILGGGAQGRLFLNLREDKGYTYSVYSSLIPRKDIGCFIATAQVRNEVVHLAVKEFLKEIKKIKEPIKENDLNLVKNQMIGNFILSLESPYVAARFIVEEITESLPKNFYQNYLKNLQLINASEVTQSAKKYIPEHFYILIVGNLKKIYPLIKQMGYPIFLLDTFGNPI